MEERSQSEAARRAIVVDDEAGMRVAMTDVLERAGWSVEAFDAAEPAIERLAKPSACELLITDFRLGGMTGLELTRTARRMRPLLPIVMMTAYGTVEDAVTAMKQGADDYLLKPFTFENVLDVVDSVCRRERTPTRGIGRSEAHRSDRRGMIGIDPAWERVVRLGEEVADSEATVLLMGESGTGKEVLARHIHERSGRSGAFVALNCAALPEGVLESELFGHEKGAFTGAVFARKGRFELAHGGTILLDEVSEIPLALQAKLLRVLQEREVDPIGGTAPVKLDLRVIATTNRDLERYVREGHFRQDLYYRLNVISIRLPALRQRPDDVLPLARHFLQRFKRPGRPAECFSDEVEDFLRRYHWPGNVRELENLAERSCLLARGARIEIGDLHMRETSLGPREGDPTDPMCGEVGIDPLLVGRTLEEMERRMIMETLERTGGNRTRAAEMLGVSVRTIRNKLNQYGRRERVALTPTESA